MKKLLFVLALALGIFTLQTTVLAAGSAPGPLGNAITNLDKSLSGSDVGLKRDLPTAIGTVVRTVLALVGTIFFALTIYAGILWMTAQGNEEQVTKAISVLRACIIGLIITMSAYAITVFIGGRISGSASTAPNTATQ